MLRLLVAPLIEIKRWKFKTLKINTYVATDVRHQTDTRAARFSGVVKYKNTIHQQNYCVNLTIHVTKCNCLI